MTEHTVQPQASHRPEWYEIPANTSDSLEQGDRLFNFPVPILSIGTGDEPIDPQALSQSDAQLAIRRADTIVLSQSCDLVGNKKSVTELLLAPTFPLSVYSEINATFKSLATRELCRRGDYPGTFMLSGCNIPEFESEVAIVDFRNAVSMPIDIVRRMLLGGLKRLHLTSPYKEHFSSAFGRNVMRVGLPSDIERFRVPDNQVERMMQSFRVMTLEQRAQVVSAHEQAQDES